PQRLLVKMLGREFLINVRDVEWLEASGNYVNLRVGQRSYPFRGTMAGIEQRLDPNHFARVHRGFIVNLDQVSEIEPLDTGDARILMRCGARLPLSRRYRSVLKDRLGANGTATRN
ncbi:MAG TPA: LytTR family DNA-binding domain-containing protein, partial [Xanthomonadaceae bacterium]|nr:LytTR family DNA-binding domain-containing protein [Xanthomonadaceae bacterium]